MSLVAKSINKSSINIQIHFSKDTYDVKYVYPYSLHNKQRHKGNIITQSHGGGGHLDRPNPR